LSLFKGHSRQYRGATTGQRKDAVKGVVNYSINLPGGRQPRLPQSLYVKMNFLRLSFICRSQYAKLLHAAAKRVGTKGENLRGAAWTIDDPMRLLKRGEDMASSTGFQAFARLARCCAGQFVDSSPALRFGRVGRRMERFHR